jgi:hypothetical protein
MSDIGLFSPEIQNYLLAALAAFAGTMIWLGVNTAKLTRLISDVDKLEEEFKQLAIEFKADILVRRYLEDIEKKEKGETKQCVAFIHSITILKK